MREEGIWLDSDEESDVDEMESPTGSESGESLLSHPSISSISTTGESNVVKYQLRGT
jgi:hypothetical protein